MVSAPDNGADAVKKWHEAFDNEPHIYGIGDFLYMISVYISIIGTFFVPISFFFSLSVLTVSVID